MRLTCFFCNSYLEENGNISVVGQHGGWASRGTRLGYTRSDRINKDRALYASGNNTKRGPLGSGPPNCMGGCGACKPCLAVHVPVRARHQAMAMGDINDNDTRHGGCWNYGNRRDHKHGRRHRGHRHPRASNGLMEYSLVQCLV